MKDNSLYEEDFLLWSEQQAAALRRLGQRGRDIPNDLDLENVAGEVEDLGRSELKAVRSLVRQMLLHLIKIAAGPHLPTANHWRAEVVTFRADARDRLSPSMAQHVGLQQLWREVSEAAAFELAGADATGASVPTECPFDLLDLLGDSFDLDAAVMRLRANRDKTLLQSC